MQFSLRLSRYAEISGEPAAGTSVGAYAAVGNHTAGDTVAFSGNQTVEAASGAVEVGNQTEGAASGTSAEGNHTAGAIASPATAAGAGAAGEADGPSSAMAAVVPAADDRIRTSAATADM
jgi:hypothetical protein